MNESGFARPAGQKLSVSEREFIRNHPLLGTMPDVKLGEICNVSSFTIGRARRRKGIPKFVAPSRVRPPKKMSELSELINNWRR